MNKFYDEVLYFHFLGLLYDVYERVDSGYVALLRELACVCRFDGKYLKIFIAGLGGFLVLWCPIGWVRILGLLGSS